MNKDCEILCKEIDDYIRKKLYDIQKNKIIKKNLESEKDTLDANSNKWKIRDINDDRYISVHNTKKTKFKWQKQKLISEIPI